MECIKRCLSIENSNSVSFYSTQSLLCEFKARKCYIIYFKNNQFWEGCGIILFILLGQMIDDFNYKTRFVFKG